jgi:queuine/archaeosine tRNA-ribosyltransferase
MPSRVKQGSWCPVCAGTQKGTIEQMQKIAQERGGRCLSKNYADSHTKLMWQCREGHQWEIEPINIKRGSWCPVCGGKQKRTIEEMEEMAKERGGRCLSKEYTGIFGRLTWQCKEGHQWKALANRVKQGTWCPTCAGTRKGTLEEMQKIAKERGGNCLSKEYLNSYSKLTWQCSEGHKWEAVPNSIKKGHWCRVCAYAK